ncbi:MAG TPA: DEAD/DEAH box helicase, partial [Ignavibacteria bacterium]|nr:DEAD/DEAH box helicase [Ignavibacteria bacterium]
MLTEIKNKIYSSSLFGQIKNKEGIGLFVTGLRGSLNSFVVSFLSGINPNIIFCSTDKNRLFKLKDDVNLISGNEITSIYLSEYDEEFESDVSTLSTTLKKLGRDESFILLTDPDSLNKPILSEETFKKNIISIKKNEELEFDLLISQLKDFGFVKKRMVEDENEFAVRGGIIDIYPENLNQPVRIEFFGNTVESIRDFDVVTQRSISQLNETDILPSFQTLEAMKEEGETLVKYIKGGSLIILDEPDLINHKSEKIFSALLKHDCSFISSFPLVKSESLSNENKERLQEIYFESKSQPTFSSNIKLFYENLEELSMFGYNTYITCSDDYQAKRTRELISPTPACAEASAGRLTLPEGEGTLNSTIALSEREGVSSPNHFEKIQYLENSFHNGFILPGQKIAVYTEHEVFGRYFRPTKRKRRFGGITFKELGKINYGDFMVHRDFGIGKYAGLKKVTTGGVQQEAVKLLYRDNDVVFVNLNSLDLVKKFSAQEGVTPKLNKLGGNEWERIKQRTKKKIQDIAKDLILLYAKRKSQPGFRFSPDSVWQKELEASFIYEDTPDQISATEAFKLDMESPHPMDRLICGDVGFGKTEVAVRAAFKAVLDNKQAAVLVPTTILAEQHYNTFKDRLSNWAVEVEHLSRFKTKKQQKEILEKLAEGKINIIIGTHRLLSKDVKFKNLGLLVIDEEQRFGVKAKEQLKFMRESIDVLTLTATPIPRTLNFSLLGARDLSIINTPPKNRQPIHTEIVNF